MDRNEFAPDDNRAGKVEEGKIIVSFLLKANEQFAETVEKKWVTSFTNDDSLETIPKFV